MTTPASLCGALPLIAVDALTVTDRAGRVVLDHVAFQVAAGESVAITGPSGAGKTTLGLALLGHIRPGLTRSSGTVSVGGCPVLSASPATVREVRARTVRYVPQDPNAALTPTMRIGRLLGEALGRRGRSRGPDAAVASLLELVSLPAERSFLHRYPHQLSGGQRQRVVLAMALAGSPRAVVLDEPTTGQDPATRDSVIGQLRTLREATGVSFVVITHDPDTARGLAERHLHLRAGRLDPATDTLGGTRQARQASFLPRSQAARHAPAGLIVLEGQGLSADHAGQPVLSQVDLSLPAGGCLGVIGATGSGKTTLIRVVAGLHPPVAGTVRLSGMVLDRRADRRPSTLRRRVGVVFQDPFTSLNPARRVGRILAGAARAPRAEAAAVVERLLGEVGLEPAHAARYPRELSGGQQQRVAIARALAQHPDVLLADEITASLDPDTGAAICDLLDGLRRQRGLGLLVVSHDHQVIDRLASSVMALDHGRVVARGSTGDVLAGVDTDELPTTVDEPAGLSGGRP